MKLKAQKAGDLIAILNAQSGIKPFKSKATYLDKLEAVGKFLDKTSGGILLEVYLENKDFNELTKASKIHRQKVKLGEIGKISPYLKPELEKTISPNSSRINSLRKRLIKELKTSNKSIFTQLPFKDGQLKMKIMQGILSGSDPQGKPYDEKTVPLRLLTTAWQENLNAKKLNPLRKEIVKLLQEEASYGKIKASLAFGAGYLTLEVFTTFLKAKDANRTILEEDEIPLSLLGVGLEVAEDNQIRRTRKMPRARSKQLLGIEV